MFSNRNSWLCLGSGVHLDEHLYWKPHVAITAKKLQRANGALSKLRHYMPLKSLVNVYHSLFTIPYLPLICVMLVNSGAFVIILSLTEYSHSRKQP